MTSGTNAVNDVFSQIGMTQPGSDGINYNFGETPATTSGVQAGQTATIGFWQNKNGQDIITKYCNGSPSLFTFLTAYMPFKDLTAYNSPDGINAILKRPDFGAYRVGCP